MSTGKDVFGFRTPKKSGSMALKAQEELNRTPRSLVKTTPLSKQNTPKTPRTGSKIVTPSKVTETCYIYLPEYIPLLESEFAP